MPRSTKQSQLQIRVTSAEKSAIHKAADRAGMDMSAYALSRLLPERARQFQDAVGAINGPGSASFALADLNSMLSELTGSELSGAVASAPETELSPFLANYVAAMVETACAARNVAVPGWTRRIIPLDEPVFGSALLSVRLHLLTHSPAAFRRRNIFIDSSLGAQV